MKPLGLDGGMSSAPSEARPLQCDEPCRPSVIFTQTQCIAGLTLSPGGGFCAVRWGGFRYPAGSWVSSRHKIYAGSSKRAAPR